MIERLIAANVPPAQARLFADSLRAAMKLNAIDTPAREAAFLANCVIESANFTKLEEDLYYKTPSRLNSIFKAITTDAEAVKYIRNPKALANKVYANRNGNGDEASGDGWVFRGRGLFQITGRRNYKAASEGVGLGDTYLYRPELVAQPSDACLTAAWYFRTHGCNEKADLADLDGITRAINGPGMLHARERADAFHELLGH
jgi:putative chitinase